MNSATCFLLLEIMLLVSLWSFIVELTDGLGSRTDLENATHRKILNKYRL